MQSNDEHALPTVLLRHDLPDGTWHVDWLIGGDPGGVEPLIAFRLASRPDELQPGQSIIAERLPDHRPLYLTYEGPVSGGRGIIKRLVSGQVAGLSQRGQRWAMTVEWSGSRNAADCGQLVLEKKNGDQWQLTLASS